ncbi:MAG: hypothetical protein GY775_01365 [Candidatus Scalindua sp.]|nr:hypothetical protein [Candidatus Scalindua sp.]
MEKIKKLMIWTGRDNRFSFIQFACVLFIFALISGCGYTTKSLISHKINSVYIPIFGNSTFRSGLEFDLTTALKDEIMSKTKLRIAKKDDADTILTGKIVKVTEGVITSNARDNIIENQVTITVNIAFADRRTGRTLMSMNGLSDRAEYIVTRGENIKTATQECLEGLAEKIVYQLEEKW